MELSQLKEKHMATKCNCDPTLDLGLEKIHTYILRMNCTQTHTHVHIHIYTYIAIKDIIKIINNF